MLRNVKAFAKSAVEKPYVQSMSKLAYAGKYIVLMYHGVSADDECHEDWLHVRESDFREQMQYLADNFDVVSLADVIHGTVKRTKVGPAIIITFDDGYANNYHHAYPILKELGLPATIFVVTSVLGKSDHMFWYDKLFLAMREANIDGIGEKINHFKEYGPRTIECLVDDYIASNHLTIPDSLKRQYRVLDPGQINEMASSGLITFGSHTHNHDLLTMVPMQDAHDTLATSYDLVGQLPGAIPVICFPNGYYHDLHLEMCYSIGYRFAVRAEHKGSGVWDGQEYEIPRWGVGRSTRFEEFTAIASGSLYLLQQLTFKE